MTYRDWKNIWTGAGALVLACVVYSWTARPDRAATVVFTRPGTIMYLAFALFALLALALTAFARRWLRWHHRLIGVVLVLAVGVAAVGLNRLVTGQVPADTGAGIFLSFSAAAMIISALCHFKIAQLVRPDTQTAQPLRRDES